MKRSNGHAAVVIVLMPGPDGQIVCPIVKDCGHSKPLWKFPGGKGDDQADETSENGAQTASRELEEETGITIPSQQFKTQNLIGDIRKKERAVHRTEYASGGREIRIFVKMEYHDFFPYYILLPSFFENLKIKGDEGEKVAFVHIQDILGNRDKFLQDHYDLLIELLKLRGEQIQNFFDSMGIDFSEKHSVQCPYSAVTQA